jgi:hypothetical protein
MIRRILKETLIQESFDSPLKNFNKKDDFNYVVYEGDIKAYVTITLRFNNNKLVDFPSIKNDEIDVYYEVSWVFDEDTERSPYNWKRVTASLFNVLDDFIRVINPKLISFSSQYETSKVYFNQYFLDTLKKLFGQNFIVIAYSGDISDVVFLIKKEHSTLLEDNIKKHMEQCGTDIKQTKDIYFYPHKLKRTSKGINRNNIIKEQRERILYKQKFLKGIKKTNP